MFGSYQSFSNFSARIEKLINDGKLDEALSRIQRFVEATLAEPALVGVFFGSRKLDDFCRRIGTRAFEDRAFVPAQRTDHDAQDRTNVYIVTKLQISGGHTKVIRDFIRARPLENHVILSTELVGTSELTSVNSDLWNGETARFEAAEGKSHFQRLQWVQSRLVELAPKRIHLFNHHQDSVAVAAAVPSLETPTVFYHHGDHHLCLGVYLPDVEHIDPHPMGFCNCRERLKIRNVFVPLTVEDKQLTRSDFLENGLLTTCTAARLNKVEIPYYINYMDLIPELLSRTGGKHVHIGRLTPWSLYRIRKGLTKHGVPQNRFEYIPWVPSVWSTLVEKKVDLYIASFPYGGGLTMIEAMGAGIPLALHRHMYSAILSGLSLAYPGAFSWHEKEELIRYCVSLNRQSLSEEAVRARLRYERYHHGDILKRYLNDPDPDFSAPDASADEAVQVDTEEWAQWMRHMMTVESTLVRRGFRLLRSLRLRLLSAADSLDRLRISKKSRFR